MDVLTRLEFLDTIIALEVRYALTSLAAKRFMQQIFYSFEKDEDRNSVFTTNIANTYSYRLNEAMIERSVVHVAENIHNESKMPPALPLEIQHRWDLVNHRDYFSHPGKVEFDNPAMKKFIEEDRHYNDPKALLLWNARKSILDYLKSNGSTKKQVCPLEVIILGGVPELVSTALHYCLQPDVRRPTQEEIVASMKDFFKAYESAIINSVLIQK